VIKNVFIFIESTKDAPVLMLLKIVPGLQYMPHDFILYLISIEGNDRIVLARTVCMNFYEWILVSSVTYGRGSGALSLTDCLQMHKTTLQWFIDE
jgi:hypothetical protein